MPHLPLLLPRSLFEFEAGLESGPQAESTPHNSITQNHVSRLKTHRSPIPEHPDTRRSSIVYIRSDDNNEAAVFPPAESGQTIPSTSSRISQWSSRAMRPLAPKASKLQRKNSNSNLSTSAMKSGSPGRGLRPLSLLKDRDVNALTTVNEGGSFGGTTQPLSLGKKQKTRRAMANDENVGTNADSQNRNLKPLLVKCPDSEKETAEEERR
jgi:hypothetical protein